MKHLKVPSVDITKDPVPVIPTVHYNGRIPTNYKGQVLSNEEKTPVEGLYSIGEAACVSVHGANRLGANSLLDLVVFGKSAGETVVKNKKTYENNLEVDNEKFNETINNISNLVDSSESKNSNTGDIRNEMQKSMQKYASVYKSEDLLEKGYTKIRSLLDRNINIRDKSFMEY